MKKIIDYIKISFGIVILSIVISALLYPSMPELMASHWDANDQVNGYMPKAVALFLMPFISAILIGFFLILPKIDPLGKNIKKFKNYFDLFILFLTLFLFYMHLITILWNLGFDIKISRAISPALGMLFYFMGILIENSKRNWFIGIRTPWTLSSDRVWDRTNRICGKLMKAAGVLAFVGILFPNSLFVFVFAPIVAFAVFSVVYSYLAFKRMV